MDTNMNIRSIKEALDGATDDLRDANDLADARLQEIASYKRDAIRNVNDEWAFFCDQSSGECLLEIRHAMHLPAEEFRTSVIMSILKLIEKNAETHANIMEREHRL